MRKLVLCIIALSSCVGMLSADLSKQQLREQLEKEERLFAYKERYHSREAERLYTLDWLGYKYHIQQKEWYQQKKEAVQKQLKELGE